ncbi:unnamed protein product, partial [marine sediment metagenome]
NASNIFKIFIIHLITIILLSFILLTSCKIRDNPDEQIIDYSDYKNKIKRVLKEVLRKVDVEISENLDILLIAITVD